MEDKLREILDMLENSISYEDWKMVEDASKELMFILDDLESGFGIDDFDDDNF
jgi:hypothetical protein